MCRRMTIWLSAALILGLGHSLVGCATHGEVAALRDEFLNEISSSRNFLNERVDRSTQLMEASRKQLEDEQRQALAANRKQMEEYTALHAQLKDFQSREGKLSKSIEDLNRQVAEIRNTSASLKDIQRQIESSQQALLEIRAKQDALRRDEARILTSIQSVEQTLLKSLRSEQTGSRDRLKTLDTVVRDLEQGGIQTAPATGK